MTVPESLFALLNDMLTAKDGPSATMPPPNQAPTETCPSTLIIPPQAQLVARREQPLANFPPAETTIPRPARQQRRIQLTKGKNKENDYESSEDTNSSSEKVQEVRKDGSGPTPHDKEAFIRLQLEELEHTLRSKKQNHPQPPTKTATYARPEGHKRDRMNTK